MRRKYILITYLIFLLLISCSKDDQFFNAFLGDSELKEGALVPYILYQNYPNPFNLSTIIRYEVFMEMKLVLKIYTEDWLEVTTLVNDIHPPGTYIVVVNLNETKLPNGEYFYTLEGNNYLQIYKMKVVK